MQLGDKQKVSRFIAQYVSSVQYAIAVNSQDYYRDAEKMLSGDILEVARIVLEEVAHEISEQVDTYIDDCLGDVIDNNHRLMLFERKLANGEI